MRRCDDPTLLARNLLQLSCDDVREPLWAITTAADVLAKSPRLSRRDQDVVNLIASNGVRLDAMFRLLLDRAVEGVGPTMPLRRERCSLAALGHEAIGIACVDNPDRTFLRELGGGFGEWDRGRVVQLMACVLAHLDEYGVAGAVVGLSWRNAQASVVVEIATTASSLGADAVGLRLAVARHIARAHGGDLEVLHELSGRLSVSVTLPRSSPGPS